MIRAERLAGEESGKSLLLPGIKKCEGTFSRGANTITLEPRFQFTGFPAEMDRREVQDQLFMMFCAVVTSPTTGAVSVTVQQNAGLLQLTGAAGSFSWRRE